MTEEDYMSVESSQKQHHEVMRHQSDISYHVTKEEYNLFVLLKPKLFIDGNQWCVLYGENTQEGIVGFGASPYKAILDFNKQFNEPIG